jgi:hypothetical protein
MIYDSPFDLPLNSVATLSAKLLEDLLPLSYPQVYNIRPFDNSSNTNVC